MMQRDLGDGTYANYDEPQDGPYAPIAQRDLGDATGHLDDGPQERPYVIQGEIVNDESLTPQQDLEARWRPSETAVKHAVALLRSEARADYAIVPMILPSKRHGVWTVGQKVETVPGVVLLGVNSFDPEWADEVPSYSWARNESWEIAKRHLADREGTTGYASIRPDGTWAVFED